MFTIVKLIIKIFTYFDIENMIFLVVIDDEKKKNCKWVW
jgi:hypothetical protein